MSKDKKPALIPAAGYLRKSTKEDGYEKSIADQKARIQRMKPLEDGSRYDIIRWYVDPGVQGWKRGHKRPDYFRMVNEQKERRDLKAILVDDMDRFSRADQMETVSDVQALRELGIRYIHAANQGVKDLTRDTQSSAHRIAGEANASYEHSKRLSRRITETRCKEAEKGKHTGGRAPYGLEHDGHGGFEHGDPEEVTNLKWIFDQFGNHSRSMNWIVSELNRRKIPGPNGNLWFTRSLSLMLRRQSYRGDFTFNKKHSGQFYGINAKGDVVDNVELDGTPGKVFVKEGAYEPVIAPALFDKVQRKLDVLGKDRTRRKRIGYALTGVLVCDHCGRAMYGTRSYGKDSPIIYKCNTNSEHGQGSCGYRQVREDKILPFLMTMLGQEIKTLTMELLTPPPDKLRAPNKNKTDRRQQIQRDRDKLAKRINHGVENIKEVQDKKTRQEMDQHITAMRDELNKLDAELAIEPKNEKYIRDTKTGKLISVSEYSREDLLALSEWWDEFQAKSISVPVGVGKVPAVIAMSYADKTSEQTAFNLSPTVVNEVLHSLGTEVRLRWETTESERSKGDTVASKRHQRHHLANGRFRLGQKQGVLPVKPFRFLDTPEFQAARGISAGGWCSPRRA